LSLITWSLIVIVTLKYVTVILRADNRGEGGILALTALALRVPRRGTVVHWWILAAGLLGASLFLWRRRYHASHFCPERGRRSEDRDTGLRPLRHP